MVVIPVLVMLIGLMIVATTQYVILQDLYVFPVVLAFKAVAAPHVLGTQLYLIVLQEEL